MTEILIYKVQGFLFNKTFPRLMETVLKNDYKIKVLCKNSDQMQKLDSLLWSFSSLAFIPHAMETDDYLSEQRLLLTIKENYNPNNSDCLVLLKNVSCIEKIIHFKKILFISTDNLNEELTHFLSNIKEQKRYNCFLITQTANEKWKKEIL